MSTAYIYVRRSARAGLERTVSPEVQESACRALPAVATCDTIEVYRDLGLTGGKRSRRGYLDLLERIRTAAPGDVVAMYDGSRLARDNLLSAEFYALMEQRPEIRVELVEGTFDRSPSGELSWTVQQAAATHLRKITGQKIRGAYAYLNAAGLPTGMAPYGYRRDGRELTIVPEQAEAVLRIFNLALEGRSTYRIAELLNAEGIEKPRARTAYGWLPDTVVDILRNPAYIALTGSEGRGKGQTRGELIPGCWEPIVPRATWDRAQQVLGQRQVRRSFTGRTYAYSRLLVCATCGEALRAIRDSKERRTYYACRRDISPRCPERRVREVDLDAWVESMFEELGALNDQAIELAREQGRKAPKEGQGQSVEGIEAALGRLAQLYGWGHLSEDQYLSQRRNMESLRDELMRSEPPPDLVERIRGAGESWRRGGPLTHRRLLGVFFERLYTRDGRLVTYVARREYRAEIEALLGGLTTPTYGGKGGIRTADASEVAAASG